MLLSVVNLISSVSPLDDTVFKKLLENPESFRLLAEAILGSPLPEGEISDIPGEYVAFSGGKTIRMDSFRNTPLGVINLEVQRDAKKFIFKRHLYYWAAAYMSSLRKGQEYEMLRPAISIVFYESKPDAAWKEEASLSGSLVLGEGQLLNLIAINTAKWQDAPNVIVQQYLSLLHNGTLNKKNRSKFTGVDTSSTSFIDMDRRIRLASVEIKYDESVRKGDKTMAAELYKYLTAEEVAKTEAKTETKTINVIKLFMQMKSSEEIAKALNIPLEKVNKLRKDWEG